MWENRPWSSLRHGLAPQLFDILLIQELQNMTAQALHQVGSAKVLLNDNVCFPVSNLLWGDDKFAYHSQHP